MITVVSRGVVYRERGFHSAFPAVAALPDGTLLTVFRRAPDYSGFPGVAPGAFRHYDPNSQLMAMRSSDGGKSWDGPELLYAPPCGAAQDGGLFFDGKYLYLNSFIWGYIPAFVASALEESKLDRYLYRGVPGAYAVPSGSFLLRSADMGKSWEGPFYPDPLPGGGELIPGVPRRMHNRANIVRGGDGALYWGGQDFEFTPDISSVVLYRSTDDGRSFQYLSTPADARGEALFEEPYLYITPRGKMVMLIRCQKFYGVVEKGRGELVTVESTDGGLSWSEPRRTGVHAEPAAAQKLSDGRCLLIYGYRKPGFGVRARIVDPELDDIAGAEETILFDGCDRGDTGYPWAAPCGEGRFAVVYYNDHTMYAGDSGIEVVTIGVK